MRISGQIQGHRCNRRIVIEGGATCTPRSPARVRIQRTLQLHCEIDSSRGLDTHVRDAAMRRYSPGRKFSPTTLFIGELGPGEKRTNIHSSVH